MQSEKYKPFQDIWLLNAEGRIIFEQRSNQQIDTGFIKKLLDSLSDFVNDYFHDEVKNFKVGNLIYTYLKTKDFYFVGTSKHKTNTKRINKKLIKVLEALRKRYS